LKRVVSVSLGSSKRDKKVEASFLGEAFSIERVGTDGSFGRYAELLRELDGHVDCLGLGGIDMYLYAGRRRYVFRDARKLASNVRKTPVVDGSGLKNTLERETIRYLGKNGIIDFRSLKSLLVCGVDRFGMAEALFEAGGQVILGDFMFTLGLPIPLHRLGSLKVAAFCLLPIITRLPFKWVYPTGEKQEKIEPKWGKYYAWADIIAGDFHIIRKHLAEDLAGKAIITNTTTETDTELLKGRGARMLVTTTPEFEGRSFGTNVMEGVLVSLSGKRPHELSPADYIDMLRKLNWRPRVVRLSEGGEAAPESRSDAAVAL
jgi:hypothetical protein